MHDNELTELIRQLKDHNQQGMDKLVQYYAPFLRYVIAPILSDPREQEECLWDVFMRVWDKIDLYDASQNSWKSWLSVLARNTALNRLRKKPPPEPLESLSELPSPEAGPEEQILHRERIDALQEAIQSFSATDQALFYRKYYYLQPTAQIASELGITERAVEGRLYRLKKRLRNKLLQAEQVSACGNWNRR